MTSTPGQGDAISAAQGLTGALDAMAEQLKSVNARQDRTRKIVGGLVISLCLDLLITGGLGYNTWRQNSAQDTLHASEIRQCQLTNAARRQDIAIWNRLLTVPATAPAAAKAEVADLKRLVRVKDALRDCAAAYRK